MIDVLTRAGWASNSARILFTCSVLGLSACGFFGGLQGTGASRDSAPNVTMNASKIADAEPRIEPKSRGGNRSVYSVFGKSYRVLDNADGFVERGEASWYGKKFHGRNTANGERYDMYQMTAAHKHLPLPSYVRVTNLDNGKSTVVRVNDRGPFHGGRIIDLSYAAATKLDMLKNGTARVEVRVIDTRRWVEARNSASQRQPVVTRPASREPTQAPTPASTNNSIKVVQPVKASVQPALASATVSGLVAATQRHYLQVAAYQNLSAAQGTQNRLLEKINTGSLPAGAGNVVIHPTSSNELYRVRIGPIASRQQVEQLKAHPLLDSFGNMYPVVD